MLQRKWMNKGKAGMKDWVVNKMVKGWNTHRADLHFPEKSFNQLWRDKHPAN
jgi:L-lactate dehydrogenase complex protein LldF